MSWIGRAISSVGQYYKEINPATLSGAIDVIVVSNKRKAEDKKDDNTNPNSVEVEDLACSPWHVRFGKLSVLRPVERKVRILINGEPAPFSMKIGDTGEAFFVFETDVEDLPDDLQTSPLVSPVLKSTDTPPTDLQRSNPQELDLVPDFDDLGERQLGAESQKWRPNSDQDSNLVDAHTEQSAHSPPRSHESTPQQKHASNIDCPPADADSLDLPAQISPAMRTDLEGQPSAPSDQSLDEKNQPGEEVRQAARAQRSRAASPSQITPTKSPQSVDLGLSQHSAATVPAGDLMLDMDGYKMTDRDADQLTQAHHGQHGDPGHTSLSQEALTNATHASANALEPEPDSPTELKEELVMEFTKALLRCSEKIGHCFPQASGPGLDIEVNQHVVRHAVENEHPSDYKRLDDSREDTCEGLIMVEHVEDKSGFGEFDRFKIDSNGISHIFEISLFSANHDEQQSQENLSESRRNSRTGHIQRRYNRQKFEENRLTFEDFFGPKLDRDPAELNFRKGLLDDEANFIVKYNEKYILTWDNASTALTSLGICRKSIINLSEADIATVVRGCSKNELNGREQDPQSFSDLMTDSTSSSLLKQVRPGPGRSDEAVHAKNNQRPSSLQPVSTYARPWSRWWYKNDRLAPLEPHHQRYSSEGALTSDKPKSSEPGGDATSATTSPPASPPDSPKSFPGHSSHQTRKKDDSGMEPTTRLPDSSAQLETPKDMSRRPPHSSPAPPAPHKTYAKTLRLTSDQLKQLGLKKGINHVSFSVRSSYSGYAVCTSRIFLWESDYKICISDIDGTITKSDALGHVFNMIGRDWTHAGVAKLYTDIARNGYKLMYLTSRAIGQADSTREYLKGINQMGFVLPEGPVIMSPDRLMTSLHREVIMRKPELFKMACLRDIQRLFGPTHKPFYAGFGNRITDALSYRTVDVPSSRIFTIDSNGEVKMELLELAGYKSSYIHMTDLVDQMFPPLNRSPATPEYSDFNYWRATSVEYDAMLLADVDLDALLSPALGAGSLAPLSPTLSARSADTGVPGSRLSFRLSSLSLGRKLSKPELHPPSSGGSVRTQGQTAAAPGSRLQAHEAPSRIGSARRPLSDADVVESGSDDETEIPHRLRSDSMPGSLPGSVEEASLLESLRRGTFDRDAIRAGKTQSLVVVAGAQVERREMETEAEEGNEAVGNEEDGNEEEDEFPQTDFSSVPYL